MLQRIKQVMASAWNIKVNEIPDNATLNDFHPWDSLGHVTLLVALEKEFGIPLNETNIQKLRTLEAVIDAVQVRALSDSGVRPT